jgi:hypothetical protein
MQALGLVLDDGRDGFCEICTPLAVAAHRDTRLLLDTWRRLDASGGFIVGIHIPSRSLVSTLGGLSLYEPVDGGRDFRVRLAGSSLLRRFGRDIGGALLSQVFDRSALGFHKSRMRQAQRCGTPFLYRADKRWEGQPHLAFEIVGMRVYSPDCRDPWIMTGQALLAA